MQIVAFYEERDHKIGFLVTAHYSKEMHQSLVELGYSPLGYQTTPPSSLPKGGEAFCFTMDAITDNAAQEMGRIAFQVSQLTSAKTGQQPELWIQQVPTA